MTNRLRLKYWNHCEAKKGVWIHFCQDLGIGDSTMRYVWKQRGIAGLVLSLAVALIAVQCNKKAGDTAANRSMVVVFVTGDVRVIRGDSGNEEPLKVGQVVRPNDQIKTTQGKVDLQTRTGSAIRISESTTLTVASLAGGEGGETRLKMNHGGILANVQKASSAEEFSVVTPTAVAGVRGTKFGVNVAEDGRPRVKVIEGKVAMAPHVAALDNYSKEEIDANPTLKKLAQLEESEIVLEDKTEGSLDPKLEDQVVEVNKAIETARKEEKSVDEVAQIKEVDELATVAEKKEAPAVQKKEAEVSLQEKLDIETLIVVDPGILEKISAAPSTANAEPDTKVAEAIQEDRRAKEEKILDLVKKEAEKQTFNSEEELEEHYQTLETIIMKDGTVYTGAVIAQTGNYYIIHTPKKVERVKRSDIKEQRFGSL